MDEPEAAEDEEVTSPEGTGSKGPAGQGNRTSPSFHLQSLDTSEAAAEAAKRRWNSDLLEHYRDRPDRYGALVDALDSDMLAAITAAEMKRHGDGVRWIVDHVDALLAGGRGTHA